MIKGKVQFIIVTAFIFILFLVEILIGDNKIEHVVLAKEKIERWSIYGALFVCIMWFGVFNNTSFVYFQY